MRRRALLLLVAALRASAGEADRGDAELVARLGDPDSARRRLAQEEILRRGPAGIRLLLPALASDDIETRRFATRVVPLALRRSSRPDRLDLMHRIAEVGPGAAGILPALDRNAAQEPGQLRFAAMAASMRVGEHQRYLRPCVEGVLFGRAGARAALRAVRSEDAERLARVWRSRREAGRSPEFAAHCLDYFEALVSGETGAQAMLAAGISGATATEVPAWADLLAMAPEPGTEVCGAVAGRLAVASPREETLWTSALLRNGCRRFAPALLSLLHARSATSPRPSRFHHALLAARAGAPPDRNQDPLLALMLPGDGPTLEHALAALVPDERAALLQLLAEAPAVELVPHLRWFLRNGTPDERQRLLDALPGLEARPELWPDLDAGAGGHVTVRESVQRILIAVAWDPDLRDPAALRIFVAALADARGEVRQAALFRCDALDRIPPEVGEALAGLLWHPGARPTLYYSLNRCARLEREGRELTPLLLRILGEEAPAESGWTASDVREWRRLAIRVLVQVESATPRSMPAFLRLLASEDPVLRETALAGLAEAGPLDAETREAIQPLLGDAVGGIRDAARRLLAPAD